MLFPTCRVRIFGRRALQTPDPTQSPPSDESQGEGAPQDTTSRTGVPPSDDVDGGERLRRRGVPRLHFLDWLALALFTSGTVAVLSGLVPTADAVATIRRILPLLLFLASVIVLAGLTAAAEVFDVVATRLAILACGNYVLLFVVSVTLTSLTTIFLNLDTTAVLLTPVLLALARKLRVAPLPFAMTTVWLANTASILLPVSNLTNLLAADQVALAPSEFAARMWFGQIVSITLTAACLWAFYWRPASREPGLAAGRGNYEIPERHVPPHRSLFIVSSLACLLFVAAILVGLPLQMASMVSAGLTIVAFWFGDRAVLNLGLVPWRLLVFVTGLFLVVQAINLHGLNSAMSALVGTDAGTEGIFRAGAAGAVLSNLVNNLPAYVAGEAAVPVQHRTQLLGLLVGTNVGPIVTPWASLATLLWFERCHASGVAIRLRMFVLTGLVLAVFAVVGTISALLVTR
jgi:arsenical pump membrane protein